MREHRKFYCLHNRLDETSIVPAYVLKLSCDINQTVLQRMVVNNVRKKVKSNKTENEPTEEKSSEHLQMSEMKKTFSQER